MERVATFLSRAGERLSLWTLLTVTAALPLIFMPTGKDAFRSPKEIAFHIGALLLAAFLSLWSIRDGFGAVFAGFPKPFAVVIGLVLVWTAVTTFTSSNRLISVLALRHVILAIVWFLGSWLVGRRHRSFLLLPVVVSGLVNAVVAILQAHAIWSPIQLVATYDRALITGLMGNPSDLGGLLVSSALAAVVLFLSVGRPYRLALIPTALIILYGIVVTASATAVIAAIAGFAAIALARAASKTPRRNLLTALLVLTASLPLVTRGRILEEKIVPLVEGRYSEMLSGRLLGYVTAAMMVREEPLTGVGPGCYLLRYPEMQMRAFARNPSVATKSFRSGLFAEVHDDHLEIAAETGIPGFVLEIAAFVVLLWSVRSTSAVATPAWLPRAAMWGTAVSLLVQMTFNFPIQLAAILAQYLYLAGVFAAWGRR